MKPLLPLLVLSVGALLPLQAAVNARLGQAVGHPVRAALLQFVVGGTALIAILVAMGLLPFPAQSLGKTSWWHWIGGLCGMALVISSIILAPRLGATLFFALVIAGQLSSSAIFDHFGWLGYEKHPVNLGRLAGLALLGTGIWLLRKF